MCVCVCVCVCVCSVAQSCPILCNPVVCWAPLSMGFSSQEHWSRLPFLTSRDLPELGIEAMSPAPAGRLFNTAAPGKPTVMYICQFWSLSSSRLSFPSRDPHNSSLCLWEEWIMKMWHIYTMGKIKNEIVPCRDMDGLRNCHTEWNVRKKNKHLILTYISGI